MNGKLSDIEDCEWCLRAELEGLFAADSNGHVEGCPSSPAGTAGADDVLAMVGVEPTC